jgi:hypothetical protein
MKNRLAVFLSLSLFSVALITGCQTTGTHNQNDNSNKGDWSLSREEFERQKERFERDAKKLGRKVGSGSNDLWLWAKVRAALAYADDLRDVTINVDVEDEVVTLSGSVPNEAQKTAAEEIARSIEGIQSIKNEISVSANKNTGRSFLPGAKRIIPNWV